MKTNDDTKNDLAGWQEEGHERPDYAKPPIESLPLGDDPDDDDDLHASRQNRSCG